MRFEQRGHVTQLVRHDFAGLLRASRPVYGRIADGPDGYSWGEVEQARVTPEVQIIHLGPGIMGGDAYRQRFQLGREASARVRYQSFTKVLPGAGASQHTTLHLDTDSILEMGSNVVLPFPGARCVATTDVYMEKGARAFVPEILLTRPVQSSTIGWGKEFQIARVRSTLRVFREHQLVLRDCLDIGTDGLTRGAAWTGAPVLGNVYVLGATEAEFTRLQTVCAATRQSSVQSGVSRTEAGDLVLRVLGNRVQTVEHVVLQARAVFRGTACAPRRAL